MKLQVKLERKYPQTKKKKKKEKKKKEKIRTMHLDVNIEQHNCR